MSIDCEKISIGKEIRVIISVIVCVHQGNMRYFIMLECLIEEWRRNRNITWILRKDAVEIG